LDISRDAVPMTPDHPLRIGAFKAMSTFCFSSRPEQDLAAGQNSSEFLAMIVGAN